MSVLDCTFASVETPDGPFMILEDSGHRVISSGWTDELALILGRLPIHERPARVSPGDTVWADAVDAYYRNEFDAVLDVPVRHFGTELMMEGWRQLRLIPAGTVLSYTELALAMGHRRAVRVAGGVCGRNAPALFVPCHRVLRSDGQLGGFAWGLAVKDLLIKREAPSGHAALADGGA